MEDEAEVTQSVTPNPPEPSAKVGVTRRPPPNCLKAESPRVRDERASHEREGCRGPDLGKPPHPRSTIWVAGIRVPVRSHFCCR